MARIASERPLREVGIGASRLATSRSGGGRRPNLQVPLAALALAAIILALADGSPWATTLRQDDTRALTLGSSDIVIGVVESGRSYWNEAHTRIFTDVTVRVDRTLKGTESDRLTLTQLGGVVDGVRYSIPGCPAFRPGEEALFFVWRDAHGRAQVNGLAQGKFDIRRDPVSGERTIQRRVPGFAIRDARSLRPLAAGESAPSVKLDDLIREITLTLVRQRAPPGDR